MRRIKLGLAALLCLGCVSTRTPAEEAARNACHLAAHARADKLAAELCPVDAGPWDECPEKQTVADSLTKDLEQCDE